MQCNLLLIILYQLQQKLLEKMDYDLNKIKIYSRIKHHYSIYLKCKEKDFNRWSFRSFSIRILVENDIDYYKVLGFII